jgi:hypothetical protein
MKTLEENSKNRDTRASQIAQVIAGIGSVGQLTTDQLIIVSRRLFKLVKFCDCIRVKSVERKKNHNEIAHHQCNKFNHHDDQHLPYCKCCQTCAFGYYLAWCLDKLSQEDRLPEYNNASLSVARIRDRTYGYVKSKSKIHFRIWRHHNAWRNISRSETILQKWIFDLEKLTLIEH